MANLTYEALKRRCLFDPDLTAALSHELGIDSPHKPISYISFNKPLAKLIYQYYEERLGVEGYDGRDGEQYLEPMCREAQTFMEMLFVLDCGSILSPDLHDSLLRRMIPQADTFIKKVTVFTYSPCGSDIESWAISELKKTGTFEDWVVAYLYPPEYYDKRLFDLAFDMMTEILKKERTSASSRVLEDGQEPVEYHVSP